MFSLPLLTPHWPEWDETCGMIWRKRSTLPEPVVITTHAGAASGWIHSGSPTCRLNLDCLFGEGCAWRCWREPSCWAARTLTINTQPIGLWPLAVETNQATSLGERKPKTSVWLDSNLQVIQKWVTFGSTDLLFLTEHRFLITCQLPAGLCSDALKCKCSWVIGRNLNILETSWIRNCIKYEYKIKKAHSVFKVVGVFIY